MHRCFEACIFFCTIMCRAGRGLSLAYFGTLVTLITVQARHADLWCAIVIIIVIFFVAIVLLPHCLVKAIKLASYHLGLHKHGQQVSRWHADVMAPRLLHSHPCIASCETVHL